MLSFKRMFELMHFALLIYYFPPILVAVFPCVLRPFLFLNFRYGDSSGHPIDESGFVADSLSVLRHIREYAPESPIIVYGHSLGTGVAGSLFKELQKLQQTDLIQGILLDAPFDIFVNGVTHYPLSMIFKFVIGYQNIMHRALFSLKIHFNTVHNLKTARIPIAIVHSEDDFVIPFHLGESLYEKLLASSVPVTFHNFGSNGYGHKYNHLAPEMNKVVSEWQILLLRNLMARLMAVRDPFYQ